MTLTRHEWDVLLGAVRAELRSTYYKRERRARYMRPNHEREVRSFEDAHNDELRAIRDKIARQRGGT